MVQIQSNVKTSYEDLCKALKLRDRVYENGIDLDILDAEQPFVVFYSKLISNFILKLKPDDQKRLISRYAKYLM